MLTMLGAHGPGSGLARCSHAGSPNSDGRRVRCPPISQVWVQDVGFELTPGCAQTCPHTPLRLLPPPYFGGSREARKVPRKHQAGQEAREEAVNQLAAVSASLGLPLGDWDWGDLQKVTIKARR